MAYTNLDALEYRARTLPNERIREAEHDHLVDELLRARPSTVYGSDPGHLRRAGVRDLLIALSHAITHGLPCRRCGGRFERARAVGSFWGTGLGFRFQSEPRVSSDRGYAELGHERNGVFL
jgi:hypothetical protein